MYKIIDPTDPTNGDPGRADYLDKITDDPRSRMFSSEPRDLSGHPGHAALREFYASQQRPNGAAPSANGRAKRDLLANLHESIKQRNARLAAERSLRIKARRVLDRIEEGLSLESALGAEQVTLPELRVTLAAMGLEMPQEAPPEKRAKLPAVRSHRRMDPVLREERRLQKLAEMEARALRAQEIYAATPGISVRKACAEAGICVETYYRHRPRKAEREEIAREHESEVKSREESR